MQVETTTLGKFLGTEGTQVSMVLGKDILSRPVIVSTREDQIQILDLKSGFVICLSSADEILPKLVKTFSKGGISKPTMVSSVEKTGHIYKEVIRKEIFESSVSGELCQFREVMYKSGSIDDRLALVKKTIKVLDNHKTTCEDGELVRVVKAQDKLEKIITHAKSNRLAPGQIPSVYEIAIWEWVN